MRKTAIAFLAFVLVFGFIGGAGAQIVPENHYLVYQLAQPYTVNIPVTIFDQFDQFFPPPYSTNNLVMDKFANPVDKNDEGFFNFDIHQTWWQIDDPQEIKEVGLLNQFGHQEWDVGDGRYLVLPALKDEPGQVPLWNHYKCYDAVGPTVDVPVLLHDQWNGFGSVAVDPVLFCNPCIKELANGERYEIVTPESHLAVYRLDPTLLGDIPATAYDQFGIWQITAIEAIWLVVPSEKLTVVGNETQSWGRVKSLFR
jgi:hypothetical protein